MGDSRAAVLTAAKMLREVAVDIRILTGLWRRNLVLSRANE